MKAVVALVMAIGLAGCAGHPVRIENPSFNDSLFQPQAESIRSEDVFAPSEDMLRFVQSNIAPQVQAKGRQNGLFDALYQHGALTLEYNSASTGNAAQTFAAKSGNCLSLVILTASFARLLDIDVHFQWVFLDESWTRSNGLEVFNEHVNVMLRADGHAGGRISDPQDQGMVIDFVPASVLAGRRTRVITEQTLLSMYMNNRAVELLGQQQLDRAYWWARSAITQQPTYLPAHNTIGVIYKQHGNLPEALSTFERILAVESENYIALSNRALVLRSLGRDDEARRAEARLKQLRPVPPFHYFDLGVAAMKREDFAEARQMFLRSVHRDAYYDKFHFWLALAHYHLGELDEARKQLKLALDTSTTPGDRALYTDTLSRIASGQAVDLR